MPGLVPVAAQSAAPLESAGAAGRPDQQSNVTTERKLFEYVAEIQAQSLMAGKAGQLANPAALGGETLRLLQGYFDRAGKMQDMASKKVSLMSEDKSQGAGATAKDGEAPVHAGPARQNFEPVQQAPGGAAGAVQPIADTELDRTVEILMQVLSFAVETNLVASGSGSISRSVNTLLRGQ
jgi:hypothetical protein